MQSNIAMSLLVVEEPDRLSMSRTQLGQMLSGCASRVRCDLPMYPSHNAAWISERREQSMSASSDFHHCHRASRAEQKVCDRALECQVSCRDAKTTTFSAFSPEKSLGSTQPSNVVTRCETHVVFPSQASHARCSARLQRIST